MSKSVSAKAKSVQITLENANPFSDARKALNLSLQELADKLNTSQYALSRWERGDVAPTPDAILRLKSIFVSNVDVQAYSGSSSSRVAFESNGVGSKSKYLPLFDKGRINKLPNPRTSLLECVCKDNLWGDSNFALGDILERRSKPAVTTRKPLDEDVSAGKNTYTYDAHTYHTKVPPQGIANVISNYLPEGGVVFDPFAGSGMTGVAARHLGLDVILNELSPAACFIAHNFTRTIDASEFNQAVAQLAQDLNSLRRRLYATECRECGKEVEQLYTVWSYQLECKLCGFIFVTWQHCRKYGNNVREHRLLRKFPCPHCKRDICKSHLKRHNSVPVFLGYRCCSKKIVEHPLEIFDFRRVEEAKGLLMDYIDQAPCNPLPQGVNLNQPRRHGLDTINKLYTERNLTACVAIWSEIKRIEDPEIAAALAFSFTSLYQRVTKLSEYRFWGGSGNTANFNVPHIANESNVFVTFERKAKSIADHFVTTAQSYSGRCVIRTGSATDLNFLPDNSIDFIFTDPPFGANINYSEMNILWESWLGSFTNAGPEAIINKFQGKNLQTYQSLMTSSLREACRVLRPDHWMVLVFMNSSERVWHALREAIKSTGFSIEKVNIFDKQHGTFKQFVSDNTAGADLMIHCKKKSTLDSDGPRDVVTFKSVAEFISEQKGHIPLFPFLHVKREPEVDFRTLYSRYISASMRDGTTIMDFALFRLEAVEALQEDK